MRRGSHLSLITLCILFLHVGTVSSQYGDYEEYVDPVEYDMKGDCGIIFITIPVLVYMLLVSIFGHRMRWTAIRFHVINVSAYGLLHMLHMSAFSDRPPFPNWINSQMWEDKRLVVDALNRSIFPAGLFFLYIEQMILVCAPKLEHNKIFNAIFGILILVLLNLNNLITWCSQFWEGEQWYNPVELQSIVIHVWHFIMAPIYLIFCLFGSCCCCVNLADTRQKAVKKPAIFVSMWLLVAYGMIPMIMEVPSFIGAFTQFATAKLMDYFEEIGLMKMIQDMMSGNSDGESSMPEWLTTDLIFTFMDWTFRAQPWFAVLFPLIESILTIICFTPYREQLFFFLTCGKLYSEPVCWPWACETEKAVPTVPSGLPAPVQVQTLAATVPITGSMYPVQAHSATVPVMGSMYPVQAQASPAMTVPLTIVAPAPLAVPHITHSSSSPNLIGAVDPKTDQQPNLIGAVEPKSDEKMEAHYSSTRSDTGVH